MIYRVLGLVVILLLVATFFIDSIGKDYAQKYVQNLLKAPVKISQFETHFLDKSLNVNFIEVQNPPNFKHKNALSLDYFLLKIGVIDSHLIVIDEVKLDGLEFTLEQNSIKVNLTQLLDSLEKPSGHNTANTKVQQIQEQRIKIKHFSVNDISLKVDTRWLKKTFKVPDISVQNFGGNSGIELSQIGKQVAKEILQNLRKTLEKQGIEAGKKEIEASLRRKIEQKLGIEGSLDDLKKQLDTDKIKNKAKDLFKDLGF